MPKYPDWYQQMRNQWKRRDSYGNDSRLAEGAKRVGMATSPGGAIFPIYALGACEDKPEGMTVYIYYAGRRRHFASLDDAEKFVKQGRRSR